MSLKVVAVRVRKKDGSSFIKVLVESKNNPISIIRDERWLKHNDRRYKYGFNFSEEFFEQIRKIEVNELKRERSTTTIPRDELKQMVKEILQEIKEEEIQGK